jgi:ion channel-forming bestrophin family protein
MSKPTLLERIWPPLPVWRRLDATVLIVILYSLGIKVVSDQLDLKVPKWIGDMAVVNGILLGVLLGFRNNQAYDRWWEARKLWGQLINDSRNLAIKLKVLALNDSERVAVGRLIVGFAVALKNHVRGVRVLQLVPGFEHESAKPNHVPLFLAERAYQQLRAWRTANRVGDLDALILDPHLRAMMDVCGACERIKSSPVPQSYRALLRHGSILYLISAPWFMAGEYGYLSLGVEALVAYFLLGIEFTAEDVEEPFGKDGDDLELTRYCEVIRESVEQIVGDLQLGDAALTSTSIVANL